MRRNYAASLQDVVQSALNALLADDPFEFNNWYFNPEMYAAYPKYLERAINLLGKEHFSYPLLYSQQKYFEAYHLVHTVLVADQFKINRDSVFQIARSLLVEALKNTPNAAYICQALGNLYLDKNHYQTDSVIKYCEMAMNLSPTWLLPYHDLFETYLSILGLIKPTEDILMQALRLKPESYLMNLLISWVKQNQFKYHEADSICKILIAKRPDLFNAWSTMVQTNANMMDWDQVIELSEQSFKLMSPEKNWARWWYLKAQLSKNNFEQAMNFYSRYPTIQVRNEDKGHFLFAEYYFNHGDYLKTLNHIDTICKSYTSLNIIADAKVLKAIIYLKQKRNEEAKLILFDAINTDITPDAADHIGRCWLAKIADLEGNVSLADSLFQDAFNYPLNLMWGREVGHFMYADFLLQHNRDELALSHYKQSIELIPFNYNAPFGISRYYAKKGNKKEALNWLEKTLNCYYPIPEPILEETIFKEIRKTKRFKLLMKKHFKLDL